MAKGARSAGDQTPDSYRDKMQALKRQHLTRGTATGLSMRYAHMTQTAVTAGEAVTAGQVIGYVGSTGDSTGNHLHFEVMQNGVRVNPMDMISVR